MHWLPSARARGCKTSHQQNAPVRNCRCRLTQVGLDNGPKTVVVVVFVVLCFSCLIFMPFHGPDALCFRGVCLCACVRASCVRRFQGILGPVCHRLQVSLYFASLILLLCPPNMYLTLLFDLASSPFSINFVIVISHGAKRMQSFGFPYPIEITL